MTDEENPESTKDNEKPPETGESSTENLDEDFMDPSPSLENASSPILSPPRPFYMKLLLSLLALSLLIWGGVSMCSSPAMKLKSIYTIALDPTWYPLQNKIPERNMTAFCETLLKEFASKHDLRVNIISTTKERLFVDFSKGKYDGVISALLPIPSIAGGYPYEVSSPIYRLGPVLVVNAKSTYKSLQEMNGKVIGLVGDARFEISIDRYPEIIFSGYDNFAQAFADLNNKKIDGLIVDSLQAKTFAQSLYQGKFRIADFSLTKEGILLIFHKNEENAHFLELFNAYLAELRKDSSYLSLLKAWQLIPE